MKQLELSNTKTDLIFENFVEFHLYKGTYNGYTTKISASCMEVKKHITIATTMVPDLKKWTCRKIEVSRTVQHPARKTDQTHDIENPTSKNHDV